MTPAAVAYRYNLQPRRGLAAAGALFGVKAVLLVPHLIILSALRYLAFAVGYVGYWIVAFTGKLPPALQDLMAAWMRWNNRATAWFAGITDEYPPFDTEPPGFPIETHLPRNDHPSKGWAVAGIFVIPKAVCLIPHLFLLVFVLIAAVVVTWVGFLVTAFTGRFPGALQDFIAGTVQWGTRMMAWFLGLTDEYPPYGVAIRPAA